MLALTGLFVWNLLEDPFRGDPNIVRTTRPTMGLIPNNNLFGTLFWKYYELKRRYRPNPATYTFSASGAPSPCSIHGLLNQCMDVGGTEYLIEKNVAGGSVNFGSPVVLNGAQWIAAFERALQNDQPQWWDSEKKGFRKENLVFLRYSRRITLVLSPETAKEYQLRYPRLERVNK